MNCKNYKTPKEPRQAILSNDVFRLKSYNYHLPEALIAQEPVLYRDRAKLLIINRAQGTITHDTFNHLHHYLPSNSHLIVNNSKVIPARILGKRATGGAVEIFLLNPLPDEYSFEVLLKPLKKIKEGEELNLGHGITATLVNKENRIVRFNKRNIIRYLKNIGHIPLPPYIKRPDTARDKQDYQTVYAKIPGSVASPTAGLHFTAEQITHLKEKGHRFSAVTLHINYGTFKPVECEDIRLHPMHTEHYSITPSVYKSFQKGPLVAVGTTSCRVLESVAESKVLTGSTKKFIYPGYQFQMVDALITNFHLPYSTLLMLVCAFGGYDLVMRAYREAISKNYRFYSYGDAMLII